MTPKFFDAHTHLNLQFDEDWKEVGERALKAGVSFVNVGADAKSSKLALEQVKELDGLARRSFSGAGATVGIHPTESSDDFEKIKELAKDEHVVAIGECGLEYFKLVGDVEKEKERQKELFIKHIELALEVGKPLMIHCRDAYDDCYEILKSCFATNSAKASLVKKASQDKQKPLFCLHFFTSDWPTAQKFLGLGAYLSFPGVITFTSQYDEIVKNIPLDRIMSETDAPFAAPVPHRGERNEPAYVQFVAERICELRSEPREEILNALVQNAKNFFNLP